MRCEDARAEEALAESADELEPCAVFCSLAATGPDPGADELLRVRAERPARDGSGREELDLVCRPRASERIAQLAPLLEVAPDLLVAAPQPERAWSELEAFARGATIVVAEAESC